MYLYFFEKLFVENKKKSILKFNVKLVQIF